MSNINIAKGILTIVQFSFGMLDIPAPEVYFIDDDKNRNEFSLYSSRMDMISSDWRDVGYDIRSVKYIPDEDVLYINRNYFSRLDTLYILIFRETVTAYHHRVIRANLRGETVKTLSITLDAIIYCYKPVKITHQSKWSSPIEYEKSAYAIMMMKAMFRRVPVFKGLTDQDRTHIQECIYSLEKRIPFSDLKNRCKSYGIICDLNPKPVEYDFTGKLD